MAQVALPGIQKACPFPMPVPRPEQQNAVLLVVWPTPTHERKMLHTLSPSRAIPEGQVRAPSTQISRRQGSQSVAVQYAPAATHCPLHRLVPAGQGLPPGGQAPGVAPWSRKSPCRLFGTPFVSPLRQSVTFFFFSLLALTGAWPERAPATSAPSNAATAQRECATPQASARWSNCKCSILCLSRRTGLVSNLGGSGRDGYG